MSAYDVLLDPDAPADGARPLELPEGASVGEVADALDRLFVSDDSVRFVLVRIGGEPIGVASRMMLLNSHRGAPPVSVDECPECGAVSRHEPWCSAAPAEIRRRVESDTTAHAETAADARAAPEGQGG